MAQMNGKEVKEQIKRTLELRGPSLPVHIAKTISMSSLFASAFLSELSSEGIVKISNMKVGGSPLYFIPGQEEKLENFVKFLSPKEREAFELLKSKGILEDEKQHPAIRVALRALKDFALAFKKGDKLFWRYFLTKEEEAKNLRVEQAEIEPEERVTEKIEEKPEIETSKTEKIILEEKKEINSEQIISPQIKPRKMKTKKSKEDFLNEIKKLFAQKGIEIEKIESFDNKQVFARVRMNNNTLLAAAYNKKKIDHDDLIKAYKKSAILGMSYCIFFKGELNKKAKETIEAYKKLSGVEKIFSSEENLENTPYSK
jgi:hypothetical protein